MSSKTESDQDLIQELKEASVLLRSGLILQADHYQQTPECQATGPFLRSLERGWSPEELLHVSSCAFCQKRKAMAWKHGACPRVWELALQAAGVSPDAKAMEIHLNQDGCPTCNAWLESALVRTARKDRVGDAKALKGMAAIGAAGSWRGSLETVLNLSTEKTALPTKETPPKIDLFDGGIACVMSTDKQRLQVEMTIKRAGLEARDFTIELHARTGGPIIRRVHFESRYIRVDLGDFESLAKSRDGFREATLLVLENRALDDTGADALAKDLQSADRDRQQGGIYLIETVDTQTIRRRPDLAENLGRLLAEAEPEVADLAASALADLQELAATPENLNRLAAMLGTEEANQQKAAIRVLQSWGPLARTESILTALARLIEQGAPEIQDEAREAYAQLL